MKLRQLFLILLTPLGLSAANENLVEDIQAINTARITALVAGDLVRLSDIIDPACVYTHASGRVQTGTDYLATLRRGTVSYLAMAYEFPPLVRLLADDHAVVSGRIQLTAQGASGPKHDRILATTAVYRYSGDAWRLVSYQSTPAPAAPAYTLLSQASVIPDVCAWPKLTLLPDGTIIAAIYDQPAHGQLPGDTAIWASTDDGLIWEYRGNATQHVGHSARFNHALGLARNGDLLVAASGWNFISAQGGKTDQPLEALVSRSADAGRNWTTIAQFPLASEAGKALIPFGNIERGDDGLLRVAAYSFGRGIPGPREDPGYVVTSSDDGYTWEIESIIDQLAVNETDLLYAGNYRWLAAARNLDHLNGKGAHSIDLYISDDNAQTWRRESQPTLPDQHPGDLLKLTDGRILLTYGDRRGPDYGINATISTDSGLTWSPEFRLASGLSSRDSGYPSSVQLADGTIVTAYYALGSPDHDGYQMGVVRWLLD